MWWEDPTWTRSGALVPWMSLVPTVRAACVCVCVCGGGAVCMGKGGQTAGAGVVDGEALSWPPFGSGLFPAMLRSPLTGHLPNKTRPSLCCGWYPPLPALLCDSSVPPSSHSLCGWMVHGSWMGRHPPWGRKQVELTSYNSWLSAG